jgi:hypothetical protein
LRVEVLLFWLLRVKEFAIVEEIIPLKVGLTNRTGFDELVVTVQHTYEVQD